MSWGAELSDSAFSEGDEQADGESEDMVIDEVVGDACPPAVSIPPPPIVDDVMPFLPQEAEMADEDISMQSVDELLVRCPMRSPSA